MYNKYTNKCDYVCDYDISNFNKDDISDTLEQILIIFKDNISNIGVDKTDDDNDANNHDDINGDDAVNNIDQIYFMDKIDDY